MATGLMPMAKAKKPKGKGKAAPPPAEAEAGSERKPTVLAMKGNQEWKHWLTRAAQHCRLSVSTLVDLAVADYAKARGFDEPPPPR